MKSRRRIAFTKAGTTPNRTRLQQGFATDEMGFWGSSCTAAILTTDVRFGSKADIEACMRDVRFSSADAEFIICGERVFRCAQNSPPRKSTDESLSASPLRNRPIP